jgi:hypothetical protein
MAFFSSVGILFNEWHGYLCVIQKREYAFIRVVLQTGMV